MMLQNFVSAYKAAMGGTGEMAVANEAKNGRNTINNASNVNHLLRFTKMVH